MAIFSRIGRFFKKLFQRFGSVRFRKDIGIDLGTASVLVYMQGKGIVLQEPSVVAMDAMTEEIRCVGTAAEKMIGRTPGSLVAMRPLREGVISRYEVTLKMLQHFIVRACGNMFFPPRVVICVPSGVTEVEERAVIDAAKHAGADKTYLIEEPVAAAIGAGLDIMCPIGRLVVDIGGGTTDVAVISLGGVVVSESAKVAGNKFDEALMRYVRRKYGVLIGERTAEKVKIAIGAVAPHTQELKMEVKGRSMEQSLPVVITLSSFEMMKAFSEPLTAVMNVICSVIERTPPELMGDIIRGGITLTGGGSQLRGLDKLITEVTGIKTNVAKNPIHCVALGAGRALSYLGDIEEGKLDLSCVRFHTSSAG